ncbi:MAG: tetratricopeptide repeat protein [Gammaproteobacteria bacterium]|nr:tetratricopeptide repeat protein [Gammaproteobacteria bacterium]
MADRRKRRARRRSTNRPRGGTVGDGPVAAGRQPGLPGTSLIADFTRRDALAFLGLTILVCVSYYPSLAGGFVWDDFVFVDAPVIHAASGIWHIWFSPGDIRGEAHYWPIVYATFWLEHKLWGLDPLGYHIVNLVLHLVNSLLVWRLIGRLAVPGAWLIAAVFAVHPVHVESVAWIIERKDLLSGLFYLTAFLTWMRFAETPTVKGYLLALALFVAGMLSKSIVVTLPAALLVWHWWRQGNIKRLDVVRLAPFFLVGFAIGLADSAFYASRESIDLGYSFVERVLIAARALWFYAAKLVWPLDLAVIYPLWEIHAEDLRAWLYVAASVLLAGALWFCRHRIGRGPLAGGLFFAVTLAPVLGFVDFGYMQFSLVADRFQYLASIGLIAVVIGCLTHGAVKLAPMVQASTGALAAIAVAALGGLTWQQAGVYRDGITLFGHIVTHNPTALDGHHNLSIALFDAGRIEEGLAANRIAREQRPDAPKPYSVLGKLLVEQGRFEEADDVLRRAIELDPAHRDALQNWAELARKVGRPAEAEARYRKVLTIDPEYGRAHAGLGALLFRQKRHAEALDHLRMAVELPGTDETRGALYPFMGQSAWELGHLEEAETHLERAIAAMPDNVVTLLAMADLRIRQERAEEAEAFRRRAREMHPDDPTLRHMIAESLRKEGQIDKAIAIYEEALEIDPGNAPVLAGLGITLYQRGRFRAAVDSMIRALDLQPGLPYALSLRLYSGHSMRELGEISAASRQYELAAEIEPGNREALNHLATSLFELKRYEEAHERYQELIELDPGNAVAHSSHGVVLHHLGRSQEALARVERALELDPALEQAHKAREEIRKALGLTDP